jgi:ABC-type microcin C transport system permease subunit YejB
MANTKVIETIILICIALSVFGAIFGTSLVQASNTTALTVGNVPASTIALYSLVGLIAVVAVILCFLKSGTHGRIVAMVPNVDYVIGEAVPSPFWAFKNWVRRIFEQYCK